MTAETCTGSARPPLGRRGDDEGWCEVCGAMFALSVRSDNGAIVVPFHPREATTDDTD